MSDTYGTDETRPPVLASPPDPAPPPRLSRRRFVWTSLTGALTLALAACSRRLAGDAPAATDAVAPDSLSPTEPPSVVMSSATEPAAAAGAALVAQERAPTPACGDDDDEPTPSETEGPYFTPNSPERASLVEPGMAGTRIVIAGYVMSTACTPIAQALIDVWHCDDGGVYDNVGYRLRGHQFTDAAGRYAIETIVPGLYPGRTRHYHIKVQAPNQPVLTTQLYFPDEPGNASDGIFHTELVMAVQDAGDGSKAATFDFVLA